ncbi:MAG: hypothetical protein RMM28_10915, partial [Thermoleophilia bacterium]|nr:hypothetical protein [Thermoleophilia bacterium]
PGSRWLEIDPRLLELAVSAEAAAAAPIASVSAARFRKLPNPIPVIAFTLRTRTTHHAILGVTGSLTASRVVPVP